MTKLATFGKKTLKNYVKVVIKHLPDKPKGNQPIKVKLIEST